MPRPRKNPPELVTFDNPGGRRLGRIHRIEYAHDKGGNYAHDFNGDEIIELLRDGSIRIYHPDGLKLWDDF